MPPDDPRLGGCGWNSRLDQGPSDAVGVGFVPEDNLVGSRPPYPGLVVGQRCSLFKPWTWITALRPSRFFLWLQ